MERTKKRIQKLNRWVAGVGAFFLLPLMLLTATDVVGRDLLNFPIPGTIELSQYLLAVFVLLGIAYTQQVKGHVRVSVLVSRLPDRLQLLLGILNPLLSLLIFAVLVWQGLVIAFEEKTVSELLRIPQSPFRMLVALAALLTCLELVLDLTSSIKSFVGRQS